MKEFTSLPLPTFSLLVEFEGGDQVIEELVSALPDGIAVVQRTIDIEGHPPVVQRFFWSRSVAGLDSNQSHQAYDILIDALRQVNGVWRAIQGLNGRFALAPRGLQWLEEQLSKSSIIVHVGYLHLSPQHVPYRKLSGGGALADEMAAWLQIASKSSLVASALGALSEEPLDWYALWKIMETCRLIVERKVPQRALWLHDPPFMTELDFRRFQVSANDPAFGGTAARHAEHTRDPEVLSTVGTNVMSLGEARACVLKVWRRVMLVVSKAPGDYNLHQAPPAVKRVYSEDGKGTLVTLMLDSELDARWDDGKNYMGLMLDAESPRSRRDQP